MNYDIETEEGMQNSAAWVERMLSVSTDPMSWAIPRSLAVYEISKSAKTYKHLLGRDEATDKVLASMGFAKVSS